MLLVLVTVLVVLEVLVVVLEVVEVLLVLVELQLNLAHLDYLEVMDSATTAVLTPMGHVIRVLVAAEHLLVEQWAAMVAKHLGVMVVLAPSLVPL